MDFILFGIQGSGKGTQGKILAEKRPALYFEMGGELRRLSAEDSDLGRKVKSIIEAGHLVPTEVVMEIVRNFAITMGKKDGSESSSIIFDGIPRNKEQNDQFIALLHELGRAYTGIYFELSRDEAERRLLTRRMCKNCKTIYPAMYDKPVCEKCGGELMTRADDNADAIKTRLEIFYKETMPTIDEWKQEGKMISIDAAPPIDQVTSDLLEKLNMLDESNTLGATAS